VLHADFLDIRFCGSLLGARWLLPERARSEPFELAVAFSFNKLNVHIYILVERRSCHGGKPRLQMPEMWWRNEVWNNFWRLSDS